MLEVGGRTLEAPEFRPASDLTPQAASSLQPHSTHSLGLNLSLSLPRVGRHIHDGHSSD